MDQGEHARLLPVGVRRGGRGGPGGVGVVVQPQAQRGAAEDPVDGGVLEVGGPAVAGPGTGGQPDLGNGLVGQVVLHPADRHPARSQDPPGTAQAQALDAGAQQPAVGGHDRGRLVAAGGGHLAETGQGGALAGVELDLHGHGVLTGRQQPERLLARAQGEGRAQALTEAVDPADLLHGELADVGGVGHLDLEQVHRQAERGGREPAEMDPGGQVRVGPVGVVGEQQQQRQRRGGHVRPPTGRPRGRPG